MNSAAPKIGFDRFIHIDWVSAALKVRAGLASIEDLNDVLVSAGLSIEARKKTRTVLNRLWLAPRPELVEFVDRGIDIFNKNTDVSIRALSWGAAIATYPFFGKVAELVGRLTTLQGDCSSAEVHRRMSETYGEREGTYRMTNMVLQSQANWGAIVRGEKDNRLIRCDSIAITNDQVTTWLIEAAVRYTGKPVSVSSLQSLAVIYPFILGQSPAYLVSNSSILENRSEGSGSVVVALRDTF